MTNSVGGALHSAEVVPAIPRTPVERDKMLVLGVEQVGGQLAAISDWYRRRSDLGMMPGADTLRQVARDLQHLAVLLHSYAEDIDPSPRRSRT